MASFHKTSKKFGRQPVKKLNIKYIFLRGSERERGGGEGERERETEKIVQRKGYVFANAGRVALIFQQT